MVRKSLLAFSLILAIISVGCGNKNERVVRPEAVETGPTAQELFLSGNAHLEESEWDEAIADYEAAVERDASRWDAHMNKAIAHSRAAQFEEALGAIELAFQNGGRAEPEVYYNLGNIYQERGMYKEAVKAYRAGLAYRAEPHIDSLINIASAYVFLRRFDEATATYEHIRTIAPDEPAALHGLALIQQLQENYPRAIELYEEVHAMDPDFANSYFNRATVHASQEDWDRAIDAMNAYLRYAPDGPYAKKARNRIENYKERAKR